jgi:hypothetical protein
METEVFELNSVRYLSGIKGKELIKTESDMG